MLMSSGNLWLQTGPDALVVYTMADSCVSADVF